MKITKYKLIYINIYELNSKQLILKKNVRNCTFKYVFLFFDLIKLEYKYINIK